MKTLSKVMFIFVICSQSVFAEWKSDGWKAGDDFWWVSESLSESCNYNIYAWRIDGINDDVVKIINTDTKVASYREIQKMNAYSTLESAKKRAESFKTKCGLKNRYENK